jgi:hypothetical protein
MKKRYVNVCVLFGMVLAMALVGCSMDGGGGGGGPYTPQDNPDTEDFGPGATVAKTFPVTNTAGLTAAINQIKNGGDNKNYVITIGGGGSGSVRATAGGFEVPVFDLGSFKGTISIRGTGTITFTNNNQYAGMYVKTGQTIILRGPTLTKSGGNNEFHAIVDVQDDGTFKMRSGTIDANRVGFGMTIQSGGHFEMSGGTVKNAERQGVHRQGVAVLGGTFIMSGGNVSDNSGNGVQVEQTGTFTMNAGNISGNNANGAWVANGNGTFTMNGGNISGNHNSSGAGTGSGVWIGDNGTFIMNAGNISDSDHNGVVIADDGTFTMKDGSISGNGHQGVRLEASGTFTMTGGSISDSGLNGVWIDNGATFNLNPPATQASIFGNSNDEVCVESGGTFNVNGVSTAGY